MPGLCTVACKLPHGLRLRVHKMEERQELVMGGGFRAVKVAVPVGEQVVISGVAREVNRSYETQLKGGFALTYGVDADFMDEWMKQNAEHDAVKAGLIIVHAKPDYVAGKAKEYAALRSGLEPIDPNNLPRGIQKGDGK